MGKGDWRELSRTVVVSPQPKLPNRTTKPWHGTEARELYYIIPVDNNKLFRSARTCRHRFSMAWEQNIDWSK
jgi:hypothetical protein